MATLGDRVPQQPFTGGQRWPSVGPLPLTDTPQGVFLNTFDAAAVIYNPSTVTNTGQFTAYAAILQKTFEDTFTRTLPAGELGQPDLGVSAIRQTVTDFTIDGSEMITDPLEGEAQFFFGPTTEVGDVYFDFLASTDLYLSIQIAGRIRYDGDNLHYAPSIAFMENSPDSWTMQLGNSSQGIVASTGVMYRVRFNYNIPARRVKAKIWTPATSEPANWGYERAIQGNPLNPALLNLITWHTSWVYVGWNSTGLGTTPRRLDNVIGYSAGSNTISLFTANAFLQIVSVNTFTADAVVQSEAGTLELSFTADSFITYYYFEGSFTASAWIKQVVSTTFTANSKIVSGVSGSFTASASFASISDQYFTANACIYKAQVVNPDTGQVQSGIKKMVSMTILQHREKPLPAFVPPRSPDDDKLPEDALGDDPSCLPACPGAGAGYGTGFGANGGAIVTTITRCSSCGTNYWNSADNWMGKGPLGFTTHCGCTTSHSQANHVNRMWISYFTIPDVKFRMRAKMVWDVQSTPHVTVKVFAGAIAPDLDLDECDTTSSYWDSGMYVGRMTFVADGSGSIGERNVWYQDAPSEIVIDPGAISGTVFRFEIEDEATNYRAEFKAANVEIKTDGFAM